MDYDFILGSYRVDKISLEKVIECWSEKIANSNTNSLSREECIREYNKCLIKLDEINCQILQREFEMKCSVSSNKS
jgi:hypothetical protein